MDKEGHGRKELPGRRTKEDGEKMLEKRANFKGRRGGESCDKVREVAKRAVRGVVVGVLAVVVTLLFMTMAWGRW